MCNMTLAHLVHRIATDVTFAAQLQLDPSAAMDDQQLDTTLIEAMIAVAGGTWNWQRLCTVSAGDLFEGYWDATPGTVKCAATLPPQMLHRSAYLEAMRGIVAPRAEAATGKAVSILDLPLLCAQALGGQPQVSAIVTSAWQMLYSALHLLDNIEDNDTPDRTWTRWGTGATLNLTTGLLASTSLTLDLLEDQQIAASALRAICRDFHQTVLEMCGGQHDDLTLSEPTLEDCWRIASAKSGRFFELACRAAARSAAASPSVAEQFGAFGQHLGVLTQITDDISGLWSWERSESDLRQVQRWTLPVAYAMSVLDPAARGQLQALLAAAGTDAAAEATAREMIIASGALLYLTTQAQAHHQAAIELLQQITQPSATQTALRALLQQSAPVTINRAADCTPRAVVAAPRALDRPSFFTQPGLVSAA